MSLDVPSSIAAALAGDDLPLLHWPEEEALREQLASMGLPRLLVVASDHPPPEEWDELEDWIREPIDRDELDARREVVRARAARAKRRPWIDDAGLIRVAEAWADLSPGQLPMARLLVDQLDRVVRVEELSAACAAAGISSHTDAVKAAATRLERRLSPVGLRLRKIRGRGYLLELDDAPVASDSCR